jgi:hypothetical protein
MYQTEQLFRLFMICMLLAKPAILAELKLVRRRPFVLRCGVIPSLAFTTR